MSLDMSEGNRPKNVTHPLIPIEFGWPVYCSRDGMAVQLPGSPPPR
ncbi:hypothetical protein [Burkholderia lata]|nr:hypothetical protein [Burkholderia lata]